MSEPSFFTTTEHEGGVVEISLQRAPVNALSPAFLSAFGATLERMAQDDAVRAVVLSSPFKVFSAGLDLKDAQDYDLEQQHAIVTGLNEGFLSLFSFPKPAVVAVNGAAIAGGLFFVLAADYRIGTARARFGLAEVRVGADFPVGPLEIARDTLEANALRRLMLTGQPVKPDQALAWGMLDEMVEEDALVARAIAVARDMAQSPPKTYASVKRQIRGATEARIRDAIKAGGNRPEGGWFSDETRPAMQKMIG